MGPKSRNGSRDRILTDWKTFSSSPASRRRRRDRRNGSSARNSTISSSRLSSAAREVDPRAAELSFRQVPSYRLSVDLLKPIATTSDEMLTELDFERTAFIAAVDRKTKSPEVKIPGVSGLRGALSYAVARAIEGGADADGDGKTTLNELFTNVR